MTNSQSEDGVQSPDTQLLIRLQYERLDKMKKYLINYNKDSDDRKTDSYFKKRLERIEELNSGFEIDNHRILCSDIEPNDDYVVNEIADQFEGAYLEVYCILQEECDKRFPPQRPIMANPPDAAAANAVPASVIRNSRVQIPNLTVPKFSGKIIDWPGFHDNFNRLFHLNTELNDTQRFHFLKEALPADKDVDIHQMVMSAGNYQIAWDLLDKRYNIPRVFFIHQMNTLENLPVLTKERSEDIKKMLNVATVCINSMEKMQIPIRQCDHWLAHQLAIKLSRDTHQAWEHHLGNKKEVPTFGDLEEFLNNRLITLDVIENRSSTFSTKPDSKQQNQSKSSKKSNAANKAQNDNASNSSNNKAGDKHTPSDCPLCKENHIIRRCPLFLSKTAYERKKIADQSNLCGNCLGFHHISKCTSTRNCLQCGQRHHTLLHFPVTVQQSNASATTDHNLSSNNTQFSSQSVSDGPISKVLLATALVRVQNTQSGCSEVLRALIDQGSEVTLISERAARALQLQRTRTRAEIHGVGSNNISRCKGIVSFTLRSNMDPDFQLFVREAYVLDKLTAQIPGRDIDVRSWPHTQNIFLADPMFYNSQHVDMIIGADLFSHIMLQDIRIGQPNQPIAQKTVFGWILSGQTSSTSAASNTITLRSFHAAMELESLVKKFFEVDQVPETRTLTKEDQWCEEFFQTSHTRQANGKYMVRLPLKTNFDSNQTLGKSKQMALNRFHQLERKLQRNQSLNEQYSSGINEYFDLNQIVPAVGNEDQHSVFASEKPSVTACVLPHHAVFKEDNLTTKCRIVFDASAKTSNGRSLNEILCIGPALQNDLPAVLLNWRTHKYVFCADIQKMYRCIDMHPDDINYQRILWRDDKQCIAEYCLTTVTFGTASAPFTAIRVMHQLADDEKHRYPLAERILKHEMYVDDVQTGSHSLDSAISKRDQLMQALLSGGFELRKWCSNTPAVLKSIPLAHQSIQTEIEFDKGIHIKTLGLRWQPAVDAFVFRFDFKGQPPFTKRSILSVTARLYDPLGFISPIIIVAKTIC